MLIVVLLLAPADFLSPTFDPLSRIVTSADVLLLLLTVIVQLLSAVAVPAKSVTAAAPPTIALRNMRSIWYLPDTTTFSPVSVRAGLTGSTKDCVPLCTLARRQYPRQRFSQSAHDHPWACSSHVPRLIRCPVSEPKQA